MTVPESDDVDKKNGNGKSSAKWWWQNILFIVNFCVKLVTFCFITYLNYDSYKLLSRGDIITYSHSCPLSVANHGGS